MHEISGRRATDLRGVCIPDRGEAHEDWQNFARDARKDRQEFREDNYSDWGYWGDWGDWGDWGRLGGSHYHWYRYEDDDDDFWWCQLTFALLARYFHVPRASLLAGVFR